MPRVHFSIKGLPFLFGVTVKSYITKIDSTCFGCVKCAQVMPIGSGAVQRLCYLGFQFESMDCFLGSDLGS